MPYVSVWVDDNISETSDDDLIDELQKRGYKVMGKTHFKDKDLLDLYSSYMTLSPEYFDKQLKKYFRESLDVLIY